MNSNKPTELRASIESRLNDMFTEIEIAETVHNDVFSRKDIAASNSILKERIENAKASVNKMKKQIERSNVA